MASPWSGLFCIQSKQLAIIFFSFCWTVSYGLKENSCEKLLPGQYLCQSPKINDATQEPENCKDLVAWEEITAWAQKQFQKRSSVNTVYRYITKCKIKPYWAIEERKHSKLVISTQYPKASIHEAMDDLLNGEGTIVECYPAPNVSCVLPNGQTHKFSGGEVGFNKSIPCRNVSTYSYKVAVALSLFLGWLGADRFYLGYPALGLLKFCTVGFCGIGSLVDFMLISMQIVGPSDGSDYIVDYYGARLVRLSITNETYKRTQMSP